MGYRERCTLTLVRNSGMCFRRFMIWSWGMPGMRPAGIVGCEAFGGG